MRTIVIMDFQKAKRILHDNSDRTYTDQEVKEILELITLLAKSDVKQLLENEESNSIHSGKHRRAS